MFWSGFIAGVFVGASFGFILSAFFFAKIESAHENTPFFDHHNNSRPADTVPDLFKHSSRRGEGLNFYNLREV